MNRNTWAAAVATIAVVAVIILGLRVLGGPGSQRLIQSDLRTLQTLGELAQKIKFKWDGSGKLLPASLEEFPNSAKQNPVTNKFFTYRRKSNSEYELCTTFATDSRNLQAQNTNDLWAHPKGDYCFQLDASQQVPQVPYYY
jgi:hypothetical protein